MLQGAVIKIDKDNPNSVTATNAGATLAIDCPAAADHQYVADGDTKGRFLGTKLDYVCITDALWYVTGIDFFNGSVATAFT